MHNYSHKKHPVMLKNYNKMKFIKSTINPMHHNIGFIYIKKIFHKILELHLMTGNSTNILVIFKITKLLVSLRYS